MTVMIQRMHPWWRFWLPEYRVRLFGPMEEIGRGILSPKLVEEFTYRGKDAYETALAKYKELKDKHVYHK